MGCVGPRRRRRRGRRLDLRPHLLEGNKKTKTLRQHGEIPTAHPNIQPVPQSEGARAQEPFKNKKGRLRARGPALLITLTPVVDAASLPLA